MTLFSQSLAASAGEWAYRERSVSLPSSGAWIQLVEANPNRWALVIGTTLITGVGAGISINSGNAAGSQKGVTIPLGVAPVQMSYSTLGGLVQQAWYATGGTSLNAVLTVIEVLAVP